MPIRTERVFDDDGHRIVRLQNGNCLTLAEYRKRQVNLNTVGAAWSGVKTWYGMMRFKARIENLNNNNMATGESALMENYNAPTMCLKPKCKNPILEYMQNRHQHQPTPTNSAVRQISHNNYEIKTLHILQKRCNQQMSENYRNRAKMLVVTVIGEQRLITFTLPSDSCTVQDLLGETDIPFDNNTTMQCVEYRGDDLDFVLIIGFAVQESVSYINQLAKQILKSSK